MTELLEAVTEAIGKLNNSELTMQGRATAAIRALTESEKLPIHPTKAAEAARLVREFTISALDCIRRGDETQLAREIEKLGSYRGHLSSAPPEPTTREKVQASLKRFDYDSGEIDNVARMVRPGQQLTSVNWWSVSIDNQTITREQVRLHGRRISDRDEQSFLAAWAADHPIPTRMEIEQQAERDSEIAGILQRAGV